MTNVKKPEGLDAPMMTFAHAREFPSLDFKEVVRPNFDTLYSALWMDLTEEPAVFHQPEGPKKGNFYLAPTLSMWTDVTGSAGWRTTGTEPGDYAYVPKGWSGSLPDGVVRVESPTPYVWMIGRTATFGPDDYDAVHKFQDGMKVAPLSAYGKDWSAPEGKVDSSIDMKTPPLKQVQEMSAKDFFTEAAELMKLHPPKDTDYSQVWRLARVGIVPGEDFEFDSLDSKVQDALDSARKDAYKMIQDRYNTLGDIHNGWQMLTGTLGSYGIHYLQRAGVDLAGLGCNQVADAIYPLLMSDADGNEIKAGSDYTLHFDKDKIPPVDGFWSLTLYDADGFAVPNKLNRASLASWMDLDHNGDGSVDIYVQADSPGKDKESNWLPAPSDKTWNITMRLYAPKRAAIDGSWVPPAVRKASAPSTSAAGTDSPAS
jgi:hypothetical protein